MLVWTDVPSSINLEYGEKALINDLDLRIGEGSASYRPWVLDANNPDAAATRGIDDLNNIEPPVVNYSLTYTVSSKQGYIDGYVYQNIHAGENGSPVTAKGKSGYKFDSWSDGKTEKPRIDKNVASSISVSATFVEASYTLTYTADNTDYGEIIGNAIQSNIPHGTNGTEIEAKAKTGYEFVKWSNGVETAKRTDINVTENINVTAEFRDENSIYSSSVAKSLDVYPNPTNDMFNIDLPKDESVNNDNILIYNNIGVLVMTIPVNDSYDNVMSINVSHLPTGLYYS